MPEKWKGGLTAGGQTNLAILDLVRAAMNAGATRKQAEEHAVDFLSEHHNGYSSHEELKWRADARSAARNWEPPPLGLGKCDPIDERISEQDIEGVLSATGLLKRGRLHRSALRILGVLIRATKAWGPEVSFTESHFAKVLGKAGSADWRTVRKALRVLVKAQTAGGVPVLTRVQRGWKGDCKQVPARPFRDAR